MPDNEPKVPIIKTDYISHYLIKEIAPSPDKFNDIRIKLRGDKIFFTGKSFTTDSLGITGDFFSFP